LGTNDNFCIKLENINCPLSLKVMFLNVRYYIQYNRLLYLGRYIHEYLLSNGVLVSTLFGQEVRTGEMRSVLALRSHTEEEAIIFVDLLHFYQFPRLN
jgi:hypothetical protein